MQLGGVVFLDFDVFVRLVILCSPTSPAVSA